MKWFDKWFAKKCKQAWEEEHSPKADIGGGAYINAKPRRGVAIGGSENTLNTRGTQFTLYNANGGSVVELRDYDPVMDRVHNALYVIPSDKDLGQELGHIVTMEALKR